MTSRETAVPLGFDSFVVEARDKEQFLDLMGEAFRRAGRTAGRIAEGQPFSRSQAYKWLDKGQRVFPTRREHVVAWFTACGCSATQVEQALEAWHDIRSSTPTDVTARPGATSEKSPETESVSSSHVVASAAEPLPSAAPGSEAQTEPAAAAGSPSNTADEIVSPPGTVEDGRSGTGRGDRAHGIRRRKFIEGRPLPLSGREMAIVMLGVLLAGFVVSVIATIDRGGWAGVEFDGRARPAATAAAVVLAAEIVLALVTWRVMWLRTPEGTAAGHGDRPTELPAQEESSAPAQTADDGGDSGDDAAAGEQGSNSDPARAASLVHRPPIPVTARRTPAAGVEQATAGTGSEPTLSKTATVRRVEPTDKLEHARLLSEVAGVTRARIAQLKSVAAQAEESARRARLLSEVAGVIQARIAQLEGAVLFEESECARFVLETAELFVNQRGPFETTWDLLRFVYGRAGVELPVKASEIDQVSDRVRIADARPGDIAVVVRSGSARRAPYGDGFGLYKGAGEWLFVGAAGRVLWGKDVLNVSIGEIRRVRLSEVEHGGPSA